MLLFSYLCWYYSVKIHFEESIKCLLVFQKCTTTYYYILKFEKITMCYSTKTNLSQWEAYHLETWSDPFCGISEPISFVHRSDLWSCLLSIYSVSWYQYLLKWPHTGRNLNLDSRKRRSNWKTINENYKRN